MLISMNASTVWCGAPLAVRYAVARVVTHALALAPCTDQASSAITSTLTATFLLYASCSQTPNQQAWKFVGAEYFNESIGYGVKYADFMFKLSEKFKTAVSVKYAAPGEDLDPETLISVQDDADLQVRQCCCSCAAVGEITMTYVLQHLRCSKQSKILWAQLMWHYSWQHSAAAVAAAAALGSALAAGMVSSRDMQ